MNEYGAFIEWLQQHPMWKKYSIVQENIDMVTAMLQHMKSFYDPACAQQEQIADYLDYLDVNYASLGFDKYQSSIVGYYYAYLGRDDLQQFFADRAAKAMFGRKRLNILEGVDKDVVAKLGKAGYSFMSNLLQAAKTKADRQKLSVDQDIPYDALYKIVLMCDMSQIVGLSGKVLHYIFELGYTTIAAYSQADPDDINRAALQHLSSIGKKPTLPSCSRPGNWVEAAKGTKSLIEYDS